MNNITTYPTFQKCPMVTKANKLSLLKAKWVYSLFHWQHHLVTVFVPSMGRRLLSTQRNAYQIHPKSIKDSYQNLSLLKTEMSLMRKTVLQSRMALDNIITLKGTPLLLSRQNAVFVPDESDNVSVTLSKS